ncbi:MarR family transcriptional regulator [Pseudonocardiaceae bacterium YIM PH 21723]|nr:MarR family transcriptional regulator [Pseudonocardiaceae bacterium YIM PH 21723]
MVEAGVPSMPARVFAALNMADSGRLTAAELAELLQASPAAISGAVRYLTQVNMIHREREPGTRRDVFRLYDDGWYTTLMRREAIVRRWEDAAKEGAIALGPDSPAGRRMAEMSAFFEFVDEELQPMLDRWGERRKALGFS